MKLYISLTSPFSRKVRIAAREKELDIEEVVVNPWDSAGELLAINPLSQVPVLMTKQGSVFDSCAIIEYLEDFDGEINLVPLSGARWRVLRCMRLADGLMEACLGCFLENKRPEAWRSADLLARQTEKIERTLDWAEQRIPDTTFFFDDRLTIADISMGCALSYLDFRYHRDWRPGRPKLTRWHEQIVQRPSFKDTEPVE